MRLAYLIGAGLLALARPALAASEQPELRFEEPAAPPPQQQQPEDDRLKGIPSLMLRSPTDHNPAPLPEWVWHYRNAEEQEAERAAEIARLETMFVPLTAKPQVYEQDINPATPVERWQKIQADFNKTVGITD